MVLKLHHANISVPSSTCSIRPCDSPTTDFLRHICLNLVRSWMMPYACSICRTSIRSTYRPLTRLVPTTDCRRRLEGITFVLIGWTHCAAPRSYDGTSLVPLEALNYWESRVVESAMDVQINSRDQRWPSRFNLEIVLFCSDQAWWWCMSCNNSCTEMSAEARSHGSFHFHVKCETLSPKRLVGSFCQTLRMQDALHAAHLCVSLNQNWQRVWHRCLSIMKHWCNFKDQIWCCQLIIPPSIVVEGRLIKYMYWTYVYLRNTFPLHHSSGRSPLCPPWRLPRTRLSDWKSCAVCGSRNFPRYNTLIVNSSSATIWIA